MRGRDRHTLDSHCLKIDFAGLDPSFQRFPISPLNEVHDKGNNEYDEQQRTDDDQDECPRSWWIRGPVQREFGP